MKKIFAILAVAILLQFTICVTNSFSYTIQWDNLNYYAGAKVGENDWVNIDEANTEAYAELENSDDYAAAMITPLHHLDAEAYATSDGPGETNALSLFYGRLTITDGASGTEIPSYVTGNLTGRLEGYIEGDGYFKSGVGGGIAGIRGRG